MALEIFLEPETEYALRTEASRRGLSAQDLMKELIETGLPMTARGSLPLDEEERLLDELAAIGAQLLPGLSHDSYSRETIYSEHD